MTIVDIAKEKSHAEYSCSASERWLNCPASIALSKKAPPQRESAAAKEGTEAHACLEFIVKNRKDINTFKHAAERWSKEMIEHAQATLTWIIGQVNKDPGEILCEIEVDTSPFICEGQFGTLDLAIVRDFARLTVVDYKYGSGTLVEPYENPQLISYALGLSHSYDHNFSEIELVIIQPRAYHETGETVRSYVYPIEEILKWGDRFKEGYIDTLDPLAPTVPGKWCKFCPAGTICPALKEESFKEAQIAFAEPEGILEVPAPQLIKLPHLGNILTACSRLEDWIEKVRDHALHVLETGGEIEGWKLVEKRSIRKWRNAEVAASEARRSFGEKAFTEPELLSPAQMEKQLKDKSAIKEWVAQRVTDESSGLTLVSASDKRPAVNPIAKAFGELN